MEQNIIGLGFDIPEFSAEQNKIIVGLKEVLALSKQVGETKISIGSGGGYTELIAKNKELMALQKQMAVLEAQQQKATQARLKTEQEEIKKTTLLQKEKSAASKAAADEDKKNAAQKKQAQADEQAETKKQIALDKQAAEEKKKNYKPESVTNTGNKDDIENLKKKGTVVSELDKAQADAAISATAFGNSQNQSAKLVKESTVVTQQSTLSKKQLNLATAEGKLLAQQEAMALKLQIREELAAKGSIEQRRAALIRLAKAYDNLSAAERATPQGIRLGNVVTGLTTQVKELESATGRSQRNVGNYASAFGGLATGAQKAFSALRLVANIIPGLGISGVILLAIEPLKLFYEWITRGSEAARDAAERNAILSETYKDAAQSTGTQIATLNTYKTKLNDVSLSESERLKVAKEYNKTADETNKIDTKQINNLDLINDKIEKQTKLIFARAVSNSALATIGEATSVYVEKRKDVELVASDLGMSYEALKFQFDLDTKLRSELVNQFYKKRTNAVENAIKTNQDYLEKKYKGKFFGNDGLSVLFEGAEKAKANAEKINKVLQSIITVDGLTTNDPKTNDSKTNKSSVDRLSALKELLNNDQQLYELYQNARIRQLERGLNSDKVYYLDKLELANQYRDAQYALIKSQETAEIKAAEDKQKREEQSLQESKSGKSKPEIARIDENIKISQQNLATEIETIQANTNDKLVQMSQNVADKKAKILNDELKNFKDARDQELEYEEWTQRQIEEIRKKQAAGLKKQDEDAKKKADETKTPKQKLGDAIEKDAFAAYDLATTIIRNRYETELNYIQSLIDKNNELKATETKNINESSVSNQEKAALLIQLDAKTAANNIKLSQQMKEVKRKEAIFDRDAAVIRIAAETSVAVMKIIAEGGLFTTGLAIAAAAFGAIQIATLLARPIPTYGEGTDNHPGGPMIVGEKRKGAGYQPELVTNPDGSSFITDRPMLLNAMPGTKVKPLSDSINQSMYNAMMNYTAMEIADKNGKKLDEIKYATIEGHRMLASALRKQKGANVAVYLDSGWNAHLQKSVVN